MNNQLTLCDRVSSLLIRQWRKHTLPRRHTVTEDVTQVGNTPQRVRVVIVDDHQIFRTGLRAGLGPELEVVGEAATVDDAVTVISSTAPDVVLLDVHLPGGAGGGGAEVRQRLGQTPAARALALSASDATDDVVSVIRAGARGYLTKTSSGAEVTQAVLRVHGGDAVFSPRLAGFVLDAFGTGLGETAAADDELDRLSAREQEVMRMIARGYAYKEVAAELFLSVKTIETHVSNVLRKLQLSNRHELTAWALSRRLL
ncbi:MAG: response regulator transcription factor [Microbacteriaceae bacterium]|nr:response regulator transcription factor [Microbacteriaceae bacterium]